MNWFDKMLILSRHQPQLAAILPENSWGADRNTYGHEQSLRRPVRIVSVYTASICRSILGRHPMALREPPEERSPESQYMRNGLARLLRDMRSRGLGAEEVRDAAEAIQANPYGRAVPINTEPEAEQNVQVRR